MIKKGKLELTWVGKYEEKKIEPRILIEDKSKSYGDPDTENMLIHGDNLIALKALEQEVEKDLILFGKFVKNIKVNGLVNFKKEVPDKRNIRHYLFTGYKKSYYSENGFDSDDERRLSVILEEDPQVVRWIKPPLNKLGLFYKAAKQYTPDFIVETADAKYMVEVKASNETKDEDVLEKAKAAIKWCKCATTVDPEKKEWKYKLIAGDKIIVGNTFKYTMGIAENLEALSNE